MESLFDCPNLGLVVDGECVQPVPRPRLGARCWVRTSARRFILATLNQVTDFKECNALNAARLLAVLVGFVEEGVTEWLKQIVTAAQRVYLGRSGDEENRTETISVFDLVVTMLGRYVDPQAWWDLLSPDLRAESHLEDEWRLTSVKVLSLLLAGALEVYGQHCSPEAPAVSRCQPLYEHIIDSIYASDLLLSCVSTSREAFLSILRTLSSATDFDNFGSQRMKFIACELLLNGSQDERIPSTVDLVPADADPQRAAKLVREIVDCDGDTPKEIESLLGDVNSAEIDAVVKMILLEEAFGNISVALVLRSVVVNRPSIAVVHRHLEKMITSPAASASARQLAVAVLTKDIALGVCGDGGAPYTGYYKALAGDADTRPKHLLDLLAAAYSLRSASSATVDNVLLGCLITAVADHTMDKRLRDIWERELRGADPSFKQLKFIRESASKVVELVRLQTIQAAAITAMSYPMQGRDELVGPLLEIMECPPEQYGKVAKPPSPGILIYAAQTIACLLTSASPIELVPRELCSDASKLCSAGSGQSVPMPRLAGKEELAQRIIRACVDTICLTLNVSFPVDPSHPETPVPPNVVVMDQAPASVEKAHRQRPQVSGIWDARDLVSLISRPVWALYEAQYGTEAQRKTKDDCRPPYELGLRWNAALAVSQLLESVVMAHPSATTRSEDSFCPATVRCVSRYVTTLEKQGLMARVSLLRDVQRRVQRMIGASSYQKSLSS